ncbi:thiamine pyrophosphate-requiring protein [Streptomyces avicenniae]|uniref:thiamine pyrophosphate-requiring protein n=1 Tax=Streptomyces avicenniae TaxID=500153 RepID=UPI00069AA6FF|nr:thiamine pyrophosphate-requiring protein [Streptomyces avicenniae]
MSSRKVGDHILARLREWGVEVVFGYPGDGIDGLLAAWGRADDRPAFVQARHGETAALQAVGHAKFSGRVGVCVAASGPGAVHLLNGLYDAKLDHVPVLALVGRTDHGAAGGSHPPHQQDVDLHALFKDVACFLETVHVPEQLPDVLDRALRTALSRRGPAVVVVPADVQALDHTPPGHAPPGRDLPSRSPAPEPDALRRAAEVVNAGREVALLVGRGAAGARAEIEEFARLTGAGVAKTPLGKDVLPDTLPYVTGTVGPLGTRPSQDLMDGCDTLVAVGSDLPHGRFAPERGQARGVRIDAAPCIPGMRHPRDVHLVGEAAATLRALIPLLDAKDGAARRHEEIEKSVLRWWEVLARQAELVAADPVNPQYVAHTLDPLLPDDALVTVDSGSVTTWYARHITMRGTMRGSLSGTLATMGCALPYAIGAKFAHPQRPVVALVGDGAMQMNGMNELITAARYRDRWADPRFVVGVWNNRDLNEVTWSLRATAGAPRFRPSQELPDVSMAAFARTLGLHAERVERPEDVEEAWRAALDADGPAVVEFVTDGSVPPLPTSASRDRTESTVKALLKGDPDRGAVLTRGVKAKLQEFLAGGDPQPRHDR